MWVDSQAVPAHPSLLRKNSHLHRGWRVFLAPWSGTDLVLLPTGPALLPLTLTLTLTLTMTLSKCKRVDEVNLFGPVNEPRDIREQLSDPRKRKKKTAKTQM